MPTYVMSPIHINIFGHSRYFFYLFPVVVQISCRSISNITLMFKALVQSYSHEYCNIRNEQLTNKQIYDLFVFFMAVNIIKNNENQ